LAAFYTSKALMPEQLSEWTSFTTLVGSAACPLGWRFEPCPLGWRFEPLAALLRLVGRRPPRRRALPAARLAMPGRDAQTFGWHNQSSGLVVSGLSPSGAPNYRI